MKNEKEIKEKLKLWIVQKSTKAERVDINDQTPLLEQRIISSLQIMDLILYIEQLKSSPIDIEMLKAGTFKSIETIYAAFFGSEAER